MRLHKFLLLFLGILGLLSFHFTSTVMAEIDYSGSKEGSFEVNLVDGKSQTLTDVPIGVKNLEIGLEGKVDLDIRILDLDTVVKPDAAEDVDKYRLIVAHDDNGYNIGYHDDGSGGQIKDDPKTGYSNPYSYTKEYKGMSVWYSGYNGAKEEIKISLDSVKNITTANLRIVATAFATGEGTVTYNFLDYTPPASGDSMEDAIPITKALTTISLAPNATKYYKFTPQLSDLIRIYGVVADGQGRDSDISYSFEDDNIQMGSDTSNGVLDIDLSILDYVFEPGKDYYLTFTNNTSDAQTLTLNLETYQLTADDSAIDANGMSSSTVHAKVTGFDGKPVVGKQFRLEAYGGDSVITPESGTTDSSGQIDFHVTDSTFEEVTYSLKASDDSLYLGSPVSVVFNQRPTAVTEPASAIASMSAVLNGKVDDQGAETTVSFEYGTTVSYGSTAAATTGGTVAAGAGETPVAVTLQGLTPETTYHYRVIATNSSGTRQGTDQTFTTGAAVTMYAVTYAAGDHGTISSTSESVAQGEHPAGVPAVTPADGYSFAGWSSDGGATLLSGSDVAATTVNGDITYTAHYTPISYAVSFNTDGGTEVAAQQVNYNGHATEPVTAPTKEGYTFGGWYTDNTYGTAFDFANTAITGTTTVYAKWTINNYAVSFNTGGGTEVPAQQINYNGHATEPVTAPTKEGYTFGGWYTDDAYGTAFDFANTAIKGSTTVYAKWDINGYAVSFNTAGGTEVTAQQVNYNGHASEPMAAPTKEGYTFGGWYTDDAYGTAFDFANTAIKGNTTVYAKWIINGYTVSFNTDGGTEVPAQQVNYNGHATQPATAPTKEGYTFGGWYTDDAYGTAFDFANTAIKGSTTVYAKWIINGYTVSFNTDGGTEVPAQQVNYNGHATQPATAPTKEGYTFGGWYTDAAYGTAFDFANMAIKGNTTVYAKWSINQYTVSFNTAGGSEVTAQQINYNGHVTEPATAPTKEGYTFGGWYTDDAYGTAFDFANTAITGTTTVYAKWDINGYTVSFNTGGGSEVTAQQVNYNSHASEPMAAPTKEGYTFGGWYTDDAYGTAFDFANTAIKGNTTVYAKWTINGYTVSFNTAGGTEVTAQQINYNGHATEPVTAPTKEGYAFGGWYTDDAYGTAFDFANTAITGTTTVYAKWSINQYTVSFNTAGGSEVTAQQINYNGHVTEPATAPTKEGYTFGGWYTDDAYGTAFDFANTAIKGNTTVYAKWNINQYTVSFNTAGGTEVTAQQVNYNGHATQPATAPTKEGYTFGGWYTDAAYGTAFDFANTAINNNTTVYAKWTINGYTVSFNTGGGSEVTAQQVNYNGHAIEPVTAPTKEGYTFGGWYTDDAYATAFDFTNTAINNNTTIYAKWTINGYTVSFNSNGGTEVSSQTVTYNVYAVEPAAPTKAGYMFAGWYTDSNSNEPFHFTEQAITSNLTLSAKWIMNVPGVPVIQSAAAGDAQVTVTWTQVPGASGYKIYQSTAAGSYANPLTTVSGAVYSYTSSGLKNGTPYYYVVKAINEGGDSAPSNEITATPQVLSPGAPEIVAAQPGNKQVRLNWKPVAGAVGYTIYSGTASGKYGKEAATVSGSVYSYEVTGLTNGTTYYFVIKATNPGGESPVSNEVSATPKSVPSAPTSVTAVAGKGQAVITFTPSDDDGGSPITGYEVAASPGNITVSGTASPITVTGLTNGIAYTFAVKAINGVGAGTASEPSNAVTPFIPSKGSGGGTSAPSTGSNTSGASTGVDVLVNGKAENAGTATTATVNNQSVTTIAVDPKKLEEKLAAEGQHAVITIPMTAKSDVVVGELNGQMVKNMESSQAVVELKTDSAAYTLPAQQINIDAISEQIGKSVPLEAIRIQIEIAKPEASMAQVVENAAAKGEFTLVAPAVQFTVKGTYGDKTIEVSQFNAYVERTIVIPDGVDPKKITTAVVIDPDGAVRHVPTRVIIEDGRYVAKINSLTNSTYSVVWHPLEFKDVAQHWAKDSVNDMGSRMVINGVSDDRFNPDQEITRAEFAAIMVRALGLKPEAGAAPFTDVHNSDWYAGAIQTAYAYQLIGGFEDGTFRPTDSITREQAMTIMSKAMAITELKQKLGSGAAALNTFEDADTVSGWAAKAISDCLQAGLVTGRGDHRLEPQASISRAEVAAIVQRLLQKSGLI